MAVTEVLELHKGRGGSIDDKGVRMYKRVHRVKVSDFADGPLVVRAAAGVPRIGQIYTERNGAFVDAGARCVKVDPKPEDDEFTWTVESEFSSQQADPTDAQENPLNKPADIDWGFSKFQRVLTSDINGNPIINSSQETFDPPPDADDSRPTLRIGRNQPNYDEAIAIAYQDAVNTDVFFGVAAGKAKIESITAKRQYEQGIFFWRVEYEFHFRREGWALSILDQGLHEYHADNKATGPQPFIEAKANVAVTKPIFLDGFGRRLPKDASTTIVGGLLTGVTAVTVASAAGFPSRNFFFVRINDEVLDVIAGAGTTSWTVRRAQKGTFQANHANGATIATVSTPVFQSYTVYKQLPFAALNLP